MDSQTIKYKTRSIRDTIKAIVAQLDHWETDQREQERRRITANASYPKGVTDRQALAQHRAKTSLHTQHLFDPPCDLCGSTVHLSSECDTATKEGPKALEVTSENPAIGIHRAIVHRLYIQACDLYRLLYPRFYPGPSTIEDIGVNELYSVNEIFTSLPSSILDYLALAITKTVEDLRVLPGYSPDDIRHLRPGCSSITQLYYSKSFPIGGSTLILARMYMLRTSLTNWHIESIRQVIAAPPAAHLWM
jgi:hypothetical protein